MKYLDLYAENYTMLVKDIKEDLSRERHVVLMDWKVQHSKDVDSPQTDTQVL